MDLVEQKLNPGFYRYYLLLRELLDGNLERHCRALKHDLFAATNRRCLIIVILIPSPPFWRRHWFISPFIIFFAVLIILESILRDLYWLFVVGAHQVQLFCIKRKLRGRLVHLLTTIR